ncbi:MAG TPA: PadR family transcriptional regulator [Bacteroidales bacterium]|nr:PadR family transcriptional regulator [Bacteroidales bacterium]
MIPRELLKGSLKSIVLKLLAENGRMYGYEITQKIEQLSNGKIKLTYGALYPVLHKLETDGEVTTESENVNNRIRIYYALTKKGDSLASKRIEELEEFIETIGLILSPKPSLGMNAC